VCPAYQELVPVGHSHKRNTIKLLQIHHVPRKREEANYKVGKYEAPVETLPISIHRSESQIGIKIHTNSHIFGNTIIIKDFSDRICLQQTHKYRNSNYTEQNMETSYFKCDGHFVFISIFRFPFALKMYETTNMYYNYIIDTDWMLFNKKRIKYVLMSDELNNTTKTVQVLSDYHNQQLT
jgi:hypothetical protein